MCPGISSRFGCTTLGEYREVFCKFSDMLPMLLDIVGDWLKSCHLENIHRSGHEPAAIGKWADMHLCDMPSTVVVE